MCVCICVFQKINPLSSFFFLCLQEEKEYLPVADNDLYLENIAPPLAKNTRQLFPEDDPVIREIEEDMDNFLAPKIFKRIERQAGFLNEAEGSGSTQSPPVDIRTTITPTISYPTEPITDDEDIGGPGSGDHVGSGDGPGRYPPMHCG